MEENNYIKTRDTLKKYFETGDRPTETQFAKLLDSYAHLNEFNFGLSAKSSADTKNKYYHFYTANDLSNPIGHKIIEVPGEDLLERLADTSLRAEEIEGYNHVLSRMVYYKNLSVKLSDTINIEKHRPKIIIERYRQSKKSKDGPKRPKGYYKENKPDAENFKRKSEYVADNHDMVIDLEPVRYFSPAGNYKDFTPSGSLRKKGAYLMTKRYKRFELVRMRLQIQISGVTYLSQPVNFRIVLGLSDDMDPINFIFY